MPEPALTLMIDGLCPLCRREADMLRRLDRGRGALAFLDIADPAFDPARYGLTREAVMGHIHGVLPSGAVITGMEVFRRAYRAVGLGWLLAPTGWPVLRPIFDRLYRWFARNRMRATGRSGCDAGRCSPAD